MFDGDHPVRRIGRIHDQPSWNDLILADMRLGVVDYILDVTGVLPDGEVGYDLVKETSQKGSGR